ncbi:MAG: hypothetical protein GKR93_10230 [Gammaproteobacteria bacterium]|nr:hypothetical protein [Gammaproteobacteria bacterium]
MLLEKRLITSSALLLYLCVTAASAMDNAESTMASCHELYKLASALEPGSQDYRSPLFNEKTNALATAIGTVTNIGYYYFGFSIGREYVNDYRRHEIQQDLDEIRRQMAAQYCFVKT